MRRIKAIVTAFRLGVRDGWEQPRSLSSSTNVEHLMDDGGEDNVLTWQDRGINIGQLARAGRKSEAYQERFWPFTTKGA